MEGMKELVISPDFTMEDIRKIREYHAERRRIIGKDAFREEMRASALRVRQELKALGARETVLRPDMA